MTKVLTLDVETTIKGKGDWANKDNRLCLVGIKDNDGVHIYDIEYSLHPYNDSLANIQRAINLCDCIVGFNIKFDLHWLMNYGIDFADKTVYDCQNAEFIFSGQKNVYPSLEQSCQKYGLGNKIDVIYENYWSKGIDTPDIPYEELSEYLEQDLVLTEKLYQVHQSVSIPETTKQLIKLVNEDLLGIVEMEHAGLYYDEDMAEEERKLYQEELDSINTNLAAFYPEYSFINWNSGDHVSAILFGGTISWSYREEVGVYKTGQKIGLPRYRVHKMETAFPKIAEPVKGSELLKEGFFSTGEESLKEVKKATKEARAIIALLNKRAKLGKLVTTYYASGVDKGLLNLRKNKNWSKNRLFGKYDQCVAITGRLASNSPNQQNFPEEVDRLLYSRFEE